MRSTVRLGDEWEVEGMLDHQGSTMQDLQYKDKWVGYDATWEPITDLRETAKNLFRDYYVEPGLRIYKWMLNG
jgi:hypothetical protein